MTSVRTGSRPATRSTPETSDGPAGWLQLADAHHNAGRLDEALACYQNAIRQDPGLYEACYNAGLVYQSRQQTAQAAACYRRALQLKPNLAPAWNNLGQLHVDAGELDPAADCFLRAIRLKPDFAEPRFNLGEVLRARRRPREAIEAYRGALRLNPSLVGAWNNLGNLLRDGGELADAAECFREVIRLRPDLPEGLYNLGSALKDLGQSAEAVAHLQDAIRINPGHAESWNNLALVFKNEAEWDQALSCFSESIRLKHDLAAAYWNRSFVHLLHGRFREGWQDYEWRFRLPNWQRIYPFRPSQPRWDGTVDRTRTILVHDEQGLGDTLQFVRYLPEVKRRCGRVILETRRELIPLLQESPGVDVIVARPENEGTPETTADCHVPLLSLPPMFGTTLATIPAHVPYIRPDARKSVAWADRIDGPGLKVGLVWAGRPEHQNDRKRSCRLEVFRPLTWIPGLKLFSLQKGPAETQIQNCVFNGAIVHLGPDLHDFADTAAAIARLDLLISVDTSVAHLAGAMARPTWVLLPTIPDWRWLLDRDDSPWYPTIRLFRQPRGGDWAAVVEKIAAELHTCATKRLQAREKILSGSG
jgi:tetratricopeptide (TPR) repeat protein